MTLTHAKICYLIAAIILALAFLLGWAGEPFAPYQPRVFALALFFISLGLLLA